MPRPKGLVRTQSILFTIYGDYVYLEDPASEIWTGTLVRLLSELGFSEQAVRLALSRMTRKGWLVRTRKGNRSYYRLSEKALGLMQESEKRIFPRWRRNRRWDGRWHIVTYHLPEKKRGIRDSLKKELSWLGYGSMNHGTWVSPYGAEEELKRAVRDLRAEPYVEIFTAVHEGFGNNRQLVSKCWNLEAIDERYQAFLEKYQPQYESTKKDLKAGSIPDSECFLERVLLSDEYRKFPFFDPDLPLELLPHGWKGEQAAILFEDYRDLLAAGAVRFFGEAVSLGRVK
ncbi:MAG: phenylacetic acid degradation operon negative regulatory protein PaaX [Clostridia bacterium]|nr:MAG: phenylacetic acid degradation operon negative regulatory protein PaaX [Clostridia bacterium]